MKYSIIFIFLFVFIVALLSDAVTINQENPNQDGPIINKVTGAGSSANTVSKSTTEVTTADGRTIVSESSFHSFTSSSSENGSVIVEKTNTYCWLIFVIAALMTFFF
jgi:hypothetical protein